MYTQIFESKMFVVGMTLCIAFPATSLIPRQPGIYQCMSSCRGRCSSENTFKKEGTQKTSHCFSAKCGHPYSFFRCSMKSAKNNDILKEKVSDKNEHKFQADVLIVQGHEGGIFTASLTKNEFATVDTMNLGSKCIDTSLVDFSQGVFYWLCGKSRTKHLHYGTYRGSAIGVVFKYKSVKVGHVTGLQADTKANYIFTREKKTLTRFSLKGKGKLKPKVIFDELDIKLCSLQIFEQKRVILVYVRPNSALFQLDYSGKELHICIHENLNQGFSLYVQNEQFWIYICRHGKIITKQVAWEKEKVLYEGTLQCKVIWNYGNHVLVSVKHEIGLWVLKNGDLKRVLKDLVTEKQLNILPFRDN